MRCVLKKGTHVWRERGCRMRCVLEKGTSVLASEVRKARAWDVALPG